MLLSGWKSRLEDETVFDLWYKKSCLKGMQNMRALQMKKCMCRRVSSQETLNGSTKQNGWNMARGHQGIKPRKANRLV